MVKSNASEQKDKKRRLVDQHFGHRPLLTSNDKFPDIEDCAEAISQLIRTASSIDEIRLAINEALVECADYKDADGRRLGDSSVRYNIARVLGDSMVRLYMLYIFPTIDRRAHSSLPRTILSTTFRDSWLCVAKKVSVIITPNTAAGIYCLPHRLVPTSVVSWKTLCLKVICLS